METLIKNDIYTDKPLIAVYIEVIYDVMGKGISKYFFGQVPARFISGESFGKTGYFEPTLSVFSNTIYNHLFRSHEQMTC